MKNYQMIAFDLDGTLLNSKKELSPAVLRMIGRVFDAGREVILSTGPYGAFFVYGFRGSAGPGGGYGPLWDGGVSIHV